MGVMMDQMSGQRYVRVMCVMKKTPSVQTSHAFR